MCACEKAWKFGAASGSFSDSWLGNIKMYVQLGHGPIGQEPLSARHRPARTLRPSGSDQNRTNANKENMQPKLYLTNTQLIWSKAYIDHHGIMRYLVHSVHVGSIAVPVLFGRKLRMKEMKCVYILCICIDKFQFRVYSTGSKEFMAHCMVGN